MQTEGAKYSRIFAWKMRKLVGAYVGRGDGPSGGRGTEACGLKIAALAAFSRGIKTAHHSFRSPPRTPPNKADDNRRAIAAKRPRSFAPTSNSLSTANFPKADVSRFVRVEAPLQLFHRLFNRVLVEARRFDPRIHISLCIWISGQRVGESAAWICG